MAARQIPEAWFTLMQRKGLSSVRALAMKAGLSHVTVNRMVFNDPFYATEESIQAVADALSVDYATIYRLVGRSVKHAEPWTPPPPTVHAAYVSSASNAPSPQPHPATCTPCHPLSQSWAHHATG